MVKHEGITCRRSAIWCVLLGLQNPQSTGDIKECGYLNITWTISITKRINEIQATACGQGTLQWFW